MKKIDAIRELQTARFKMEIIREQVWKMVSTGEFRKGTIDYVDALAEQSVAILNDLEINLKLAKEQKNAKR